MNVFTQIDYMRLWGEVLSSEWTLDANELRCGDTPVLTIPMAESGDVGTLIRREMLVNLLNVINETVNPSDMATPHTGPWQFGSNTLYFNNVIFAYMPTSIGADENNPFYKAAISYLVNALNKVTPKKVDMNYSMIPVTGNDGCVTVTGEITERTIVIDENGAVVNANMVNGTDTIYRGVYSPMMGFAKIERIPLQGMGLNSSKEPILLSRDDYIQLLDLNENAAGALSCKDLGNDQLLVSNTSITKILITI